jgi:hypothetical protein
LLRAAHVTAGVLTILLLIAEWLVAIAIGGLDARPFPVVA